MVMIIINETFKKLIPPLSTEEYSQLEKNILAEGIREPILLWNKQIIDGHNRYSVATKHNLEYKTTEKQFDSEKEVKEYMILNQFGRRNLSNYQRSILALELEDIFKVKAKENLIKGALLTNEKKTTPLATLPNPLEKINSRVELSKIANVGDRTMGKVKKIRDEASEEMKQKLEQGTVSINEAYNQMKREEKIIQFEQKKKEYKTVAKTITVQNYINSCCLEGIKNLEDNSIDLLITDPPYGYNYSSNRSIGNFTNETIANDSAVKIATDLFEEML
ncbi:MAG: hypothetical protein ACRC5T_08325, partial [Cetobacterium sp.]